MEETLVTAAVDLSGRFWYVGKFAFPTEKIGEFDAQLVDVFWQAGTLPDGVWAPDQGVAPYRGRG